MHWLREVAWQRRHGTTGRAPLEMFDAEERGALLLGTEADGLSDAALSRADARVRIGMVDGFDSINVATACGVALHHFFSERPANG